MQPTQITPEQLGDVHSILIKRTDDGTQFTAFVFYDDDPEAAEACDGMGDGPTIDAAITAAIADLD